MPPRSPASGESRIGDKVNTEVAYIVTSLPASEAGPERLLALVRAHWGIENRLHYVRDVSMTRIAAASVRVAVRSPRSATSSSP